MRLALLLIALASVAGDASAGSQEDLTQGIAQIDQKFTEFLSKNCTEERKQLCAAMTGFRSGALPAADVFVRPFYLGRLHSLHMDFRQSLDHPHTTALLMLGGTVPKRFARYEELSGETPDEQALIDDAQRRIAQGKEPVTSVLTKYIAKLSAQNHFQECKIAGNTYVCRDDSARTPVLMIRQHNGNLYSVAFGMVPFRPGSFDEVAGLYIAEYKRGDK